MRLEFRIPISPNPAFYSQVRLIAQSLERLGAPYSTARIQVSIGEQPDPQAVALGNRWSTAFPVEWYVVPDEVSRTMLGPHWVSGQGRFVTDPDADVVIFLDADTCPVARFDELLARMATPQPLVAALQAHRSPFKGLDNDATWLRLLDAVGQPAAALSARYSLDTKAQWGAAPPYFNYGFVAFNPAGFRQIAALVDSSLRTACAVLPQQHHWGAAQVALTLALLRGGVEPIQLGFEYNCPNNQEVLQPGLVDLEALKIIHYQSRNEFDRQQFLWQRHEFDAFMAADLHNPVNLLLRAHIRSIPDAFIEWQ